jgi:hypothetical protein
MVRAISNTAERGANPDSTKSFFHIKTPVQTVNDFFYSHYIFFVILSGSFSSLSGVEASSAFSL